ncbi:MAG: putative sulfate exporter family transporter, partial [Burkholderiales bacterium]|nr:putative sulfate exporter family transporter [Burkholderiales bacterium]
KAHAEKVTVAVSTVVVFGTVAIFLYPLLYTLNLHWGFVPPGVNAFGIYAGSTIHEVAQVVAAARSVSAQTADTAVIAKMVRVMMLAPFLIALSTWLAREAKHKAGVADRTAQRRLDVPWFAFLFVAVVVFNSLSLLPKSVVSVATDLDTLLLAMAMGALGLTTHVSSIRKAGVKPLLLAALLFGWLIAGGAAINSLVSTLLR